MFRSPVGDFVRLRWLLFAFAAFGLLLAGCTQNQPAAGQNATAGANAPGGAAAAPAVTAPGTPSSPSTPVVSPPSAGAKAELTRLASLMNSTAWKATYTVDMQPSTAGASLSSMGLYYDGKDRARIDVTANAIELRAYYTSGPAASGSGVVCIGSDANWTCIKSETAPNDTFKGLNGNIAEYNVASLPGRTIAGAAVSCYNITSIKNMGGTSWAAECYSPAGPLLYLQVAADSSGTSQLTTMTATSFSTTVPDSDFTLPAEPQDMSQYYNQNYNYTDTGGYG